MNLLDMVEWAVASEMLVEFWGKLFSCMPYATLFSIMWYTIECLWTEAKSPKNMLVINNCLTRSTLTPNKNLGFPSHEGLSLSKRVCCNCGLRVDYWSPLGLCYVNNVFMSPTYKNVVSHRRTRRIVNPKWDSWPPFSTGPRVVSRAEA